MWARRAGAAALVLATQVAAVTAPADRYFGKLKMSALRIRYETMQLKARYETHALLPDQAIHLLLLTEDAFQQWARLYPKDPWLASSGFAMAQLYEELPGMLARDHAVALLIFVKSSFPATAYARRSRDQLHRGVPVKPEPASPAPAVTGAPTAASETPSTKPSPTR
jgi:hypothetical protein